MRIYGNRQIKTLPGLETRPTAARVREAVFFRWRAAIADCRWLDLCCGSGAMGAEALCHGAAVVIGVEHSRRACALIRQNWQGIAHPPQTFQVYCADVVRSLPKLAGQTFDRIYFDPPYASDLYLPVLAGIAHYQLLAPSGELALEHDPKRVPAIDPAHFTVLHQKTYGSTALMLLQSREP